MKAAAAAMPVDAVEALLGEHDEALAAQREISEALGGEATAGGGELSEEDAELLRELGQLTAPPPGAAAAEAEEEEEAMPAAPTAAPVIAEPAASPEAAPEREAVLA